MKHIIVIFSLLLSTTAFADAIQNPLSKKAPHAQVSVEEMKGFAQDAAEFVINGVTYVATKTAEGVVLVYQVAKDDTLKVLKAGSEYVQQVVEGATYIVIKTVEGLVKVYKFAKDGTLTALDYIAKKFSNGVGFIVVETTKGASLLIELGKNGVIKIVKFGAELIEAIKNLPSPTCNGQEVNFGGGNMLCM